MIQKWCVMVLETWWLLSWFSQVLDPARRHACNIWWLQYHHRHCVNNLIRQNCSVYEWGNTIQWCLKIPTEFQLIITPTSIQISQISCVNRAQYRRRYRTSSTSDFCASLTQHLSLTVTTHSSVDKFSWLLRQLPLSTVVFDWHDTIQPSTALAFSWL